MKHSRILTGSLATLVVFVLLAAGCGPKPQPQQSVLDTPDNHYNRGMVEFEKGDLAAALEEFTWAMKLNPDYPEAFAGKGLVFAQKASESTDGKIRKNLYKDAFDMVDKALDKNGKSYDSRVIKGRIIAMEQKGDTEDWVRHAEKEFDKAYVLNDNNPKAHFYKGMMYKTALYFTEAANEFSTVISKKTDYSTEADAEYELIQKIRRAAPGTKIGMKIALINKIDRADLAVLLMEELKLMTLLEKKRPKVYDTGFQAPDDPTKMAQAGIVGVAAMTDISSHWAKNWIEDIVEAKGMEPYPDHTFRPDSKINRALYAQIMQNVLIMATANETLATRYVGEPSRFPDVNSSHFAYNSCALMVDRGIMAAEMLSGEFDLNGTISGADALLSIRKFQNALRMEF